MKSIYKLLYQIIFFILLACSKAPGESSTPNQPIVQPTPTPLPVATGDTAKLIKLPKGWKFDMVLSKGFPEGIEAYSFDTIFSNAKVKAFAVAFNPKISYLELKPLLSGTAKKPSEFYAQETDTKFACLNAGFFGGNQSYSLIKYNAVFSPNIKSVSRSYNGANVPYYPTRAAFGISSSGDPSVEWIYHVGNTNDIIYRYTEPSPNRLGSPPQPVPDERFPAGGNIWTVPIAVGGSPMLLKGGSVWISDEEELISINNTDNRPRSAIAHTDKGIIILLAVEGDNTTDGYPGINLAKLAEFIKYMGCTGAINLDGGGSTSFIINGQSTVRPSGGVERAVPGVVFIKRK
jgi:hypothetical protein